ncbi:MAG TPA: thioredoxin family protein [Desulfosarcina sp.]|nr:thioredoxin family protein [Desulfosarcina sp.]
MGWRRIVGGALGVLGLAAFLSDSAVVAAHAQDFSHVPVKGMVTMIDLGADQCVPCKMMAPVLEKLKKEYADKAAIVFIDVWKHKEPIQRFGIRAIPTQIFFDPGGKEVHRHVGFMSEKDIVAQLARMGVK